MGSVFVREVGAEASKTLSIAILKKKVQNHGINASTLRTSTNHYDLPCTGAVVEAWRRTNAP